MAKENSEGFTLLNRLMVVAKTKSGRKHLRQTWRFALNQALRAASGVQISEVLDELGRLSRGWKDSLTIPPKQSFTRGEFLSRARDMSAGKQSGHEFAYQYLDFDRDSPIKVLEIGIGTNDPTAPSSMGKDGKPGSSLEMWTSLFPNSTVYGADVDPSALVTGARIKSFLVDSTDLTSIDNLIGELKAIEPLGFDLVIDDGLHTPESNLRLLNLLSPLVKPGGFYVVEDVPKPWTGFWRTVVTSLAVNFQSAVVSDDDSIQGSSTFIVLRRIEQI